MEHTSSKTSCTPSTCSGSWRAGQAFTYDLVGDLTTYSNGVGVTITENYDGAARLGSVTSSWHDSQHPATLWSATSYDPIGLTGATLGNGLINTIQHDNRERLASSTIKNASSQILYQYSLGYYANNSLQSANDTSNGNWSYTIDHLNRLLTASATSGPYSGTSLQWGMDAFGNRATQTATAGSAPQPQFTMNSNNQIVGYCYDNAGNLLHASFCLGGSGGNPNIYDGAGRLTSPDFGNTQYIYDATGMRVAKQSSGASTYEYLYDLVGNQIAELTPGPVLSRGEIYAGGMHLATYSGGSTYFAGDDWLSNEREHSQVGGGQQDTCYTLPYGDDLGGCSLYGVNPLHFTGKERDAESGNDYFGARYYASTMGRFLSPDPSVLDYADPTNPQSLNLYGYVYNNPLINIDPSALACIHINVDTGVYEGFESGDCDNSTEEKANSGQYIDGTVRTIFTTTGTDQGVVTGFSGTSDSGNLMTGTFATGQGSNLDTSIPDTGGDVPLNPTATAIFRQVAKVTRSMPWLCNAGASLRAQVPRTPFSFGFGLDRNGLAPSAKFGGTSPFGGAAVTTNGKSVRVSQATAPISPVLNATLSTGTNKVTVGLSRSFKFGGQMSASGALTFGYLGDSTCR